LSRRRRTDDAQPGGDSTRVTTSTQDAGQFDMSESAVKPGSDATAILRPSSKAGRSAPILRQARWDALRVKVVRQPCRKRRFAGLGAAAKARVEGGGSAAWGSSGTQARSSPGLHQLRPDASGSNGRSPRQQRRCSMDSMQCPTSEAPSGEQRITRQGENEQGVSSRSPTACTASSPARAMAFFSRRVARCVFRTNVTEDSDRS
jgi:hypothetical protein